MDILYLIHAILRKKWIILSSTVVAILAAYVFTVHNKKVYESVAEIATGFTMNDQPVLVNQGFSLYDANIKFDNVIATMKSTQVVSLVTYELMLHDLNDPQNAFRNLENHRMNEAGFTKIGIDKTKEIFQNKSSIMQPLSSYNPQERDLIELTKSYGYDPESILKDLSVYRLGNTDYIDIAYQSENPLLSSFVVNKLCSEFNRFYSTYLSKRSAENITMLDTILARKKNELQLKQDMLAKAMSGNNTDLMSANLDLLKQYQSQLSQEKTNLAAATLTLKEVNKQINQANSAGSSPSSVNDEIIVLKRQIDNLYAQYVNNGSKDTELFNKINALRNTYQEKIAAIPSSPTGRISKADLLQKKSDLELQEQLANQNISSLESSIKNISSTVQSNGSKDAIVNALQKEVDMATQDYANTKDKYSLMANTSAAEAGFKQILLGQPAVDPKPSKKWMILALSGMSMFLLSSFIILFLEYIDTSIKTPSHFSKLVNLRLISVMNCINLKKNSLTDIISREAQPNQKRENSFRELLRKLRYEIEIDSERKVFLFTSTKPKEGKTTLVQALSYSLSLGKKRVLILDTNFCNNDLTLQLNAAPKLEEFYVNGEGFSKNKVKEIISPTGITNVDVIGCKGGDYTPLEILPKNNLLHYLSELKEEYDYIFLEGAPLNEYADSKELLEYVDGVIAVFSVQSTLNETDRESIDFLKTLGSKFTGAILNKVEFYNLEM